MKDVEFGQVRSNLPDDRRYCYVRLVDGVIMSCSCEAEKEAIGAGDQLEW